MKRDDTTPHALAAEVARLAAEYNFTDFPQQDNGFILGARRLNGRWVRVTFSHDDEEHKPSNELSLILAEETVVISRCDRGICECLCWVRFSERSDPWIDVGVLNDAALNRYADLVYERHWERLQRGTAFSRWGVDGHWSDPYNPPEKK